MDCEKAFQKLKDKLISNPILGKPLLDKAFIVSTDASAVAVGAVLAQKDEEGPEYVVQYASRALKGAELNYGITEKECLAVRWAIAKFRAYLFGVLFTVRTDHKALKALMDMKDLNARLGRWVSFLQAFNFIV